MSMDRFSGSSMRILHVTLGFPPAVAWGGPVKIVQANVEELAHRGHHLTVFCTNLLDKQSKIQHGTFERQINGIRVVYFDTWHLPWWPGTLGPVWLPDLPNYLQRELDTFDVIHLNGYRNLMNIPVAKVAWKNNKPLLMQPHGAMPIVINSFWVKRFYDRILGGKELRAVTALVALQESEKQAAILHGVLSSRIEIIPNGLDINKYALPERGRFRKKNNLPADAPLILFLGRINRIKGADMLVEAFAKLELANIYLAIVGSDDGQLEEVTALIDKYNLEDRIVLTGLLSGDAVNEAYADASLFVLPSRADAFPTTIMEACLAGLPMVITDRCEIAHLVKDRVADIVPFNADAFANAMRRLLTDHSHYNFFQSNCPALMQDTFSIVSTVDKLELLYKKVIAQKEQGL